MSGVQAQGRRDADVEAFSLDSGGVESRLAMKPSGFGEGGSARCWCVGQEARRKKIVMRRFSLHREFLKAYQRGHPGFLLPE